MMRPWPALCLAATLGLPAHANEPPAAPEEPIYTSVRSRMYLRLDPSSVPNPDGRIEPAALGSVRLVTRGDVDVEMSGWIGHAPGNAAYSADDLSGTLTSLLFTNGWGPLKLTVGRQWSRIGARRLTALDGATLVGRFMDGRVEVAGRTGLSGLDPKDAFGDIPEVGGHVAFLPFTHTRLELGVLHQRPAGVRQRTRWTAGVDWKGPIDSLGANLFATTDVESQALVDARLESFWRPTDTLWFRGYGRHTRMDLLLAADEVLAVFAQDIRDEIGAVAEYLVLPNLRFRLDGAAIYSRDRVGAGRYRLAADGHTHAGSKMVAELTAIVDRTGRSGTLRLAGRWPIVRSLFGTVETLGDLEAEGGPAAYGRVGTGFEPWPGWFAYCALETAHADRWPDGRLSGMLLLEHALGAPVRWGSGP